MTPRLAILLAVALVPLVTLRTPAQQPPRPPAKGAAQRDSAAKADSIAKPDSTEADSTKDEPDEPPPAITSGLSFGGLSYDGGRSERATSAVLRWHALPWLSLGITPTFAQSSEPSVTNPLQTTRKIGLTDLPVEISADHGFDARLSPSLSLGIGVTAPVGDTATGFGSGVWGASVTLGGGLALSDKLGVHASAGRSLTDFSIQSSYNGTSSEFGDAGMSFQANDTWSMSLGVDGDIGQADTTYGRAASLSGGVSMTVPYLNSVSLNASRGISGATPTWSFALGFGTDFASVGSVSLTSAASRLRRTFGGGTHGLVTKGSTKKPTRKKHA